MHKKIREIISLTVIITIMLSNSTSVLAESKNLKDENVYVLLNNDGSLNEVYIVNAYTDYVKGRFIDYGNYDSVKNLTTKDKIDINNGLVTSTIAYGKFCYQGKVKDPQIPWDISIKYTLDGKHISPKELAGKSGSIEISIGISKNENSNSVFYENYVVQVSTLLDTNQFSNIVAENGTIVNIGDNKNISFMLLPKKEGNFKISTDAINFEMDEFSIICTPFNMNIELDKLSDITSGIPELVDGIEKLDNGSKKLKRGSRQYKDSIDQLASQSDSIISSSNNILKSIIELTASVEAMGKKVPQELQIALVNLKEHYEQMNPGILQYVTGVKNLSVGYNSINYGVSEIQNVTSELRNKTLNLEDDINYKIDNALKDIRNQDFQPVSFASEKNTNISSVQFIMKTNRIEITKPDVVADEIVKKLSLWDKIVNLFKR